MAGKVCKSFVATAVAVSFALLGAPGAPSASAASAAPGSNQPTPPRGALGGLLGGGLIEVCLINPPAPPPPAILITACPVP
ncbi:MAG TPA: hypothetical protein VHU88_03410 [Sporichthyaceae bacterium]|jgi:hypothetical protein|nr:hypothetical protein [Sporichthyaceae bacterium]